MSGSGIFRWRNERSVLAQRTALNAHPILLVLLISVVSVLLAEIPLGIRVPAMVLQMVLGIIAGPQVLGLVAPDAMLEWLGGVAGLAGLFFMVGLELDLGQVKGRPLTLALRGWLLSLALGLAAAGLLHLLPFVHAPFMIALALTTTALGLLSPILHDAGEHQTSFGRMALAAGAVGEFGPIVGISIALTSESSHWEQAWMMLAFMALALLAALVALGLRPPGVLALLSRTMHSSAQLPVLFSMTLLAGFVVLAEGFGLEIVMGAFAAGMVTGLATRGEEGKPLREKIEAISYGFFVPFFFVLSGMKFDLRALLGSATSMLLVPMFLGLFLLVRGAPAWLLYRGDLPWEERLPFMLYTSTGLPIVVAITQIGTMTGRMSTEIAAALVGAGVLSVLVFPTIAGTLRARALQRAPGASGGERGGKVAPDGS